LKEHIEQCDHLGEKVMTPKVVLILISIIAGVVGIIVATPKDPTVFQGIAGLGILSVACLVAIFARMLQASEHQNETRRLLEEVARRVTDGERARI
jgi:membrane protein implicated in regulation of membrane protease activity